LLITIKNNNDCHSITEILWEKMFEKMEHCGDIMQHAMFMISL